MKRKRELKVVSEDLYYRNWQGYTPNPDDPEHYHPHPHLYGEGGLPPVILGYTAQNKNLELFFESSYYYYKIQLRRTLVVNIFIVAAQRCLAQSFYFLLSQIHTLAEIFRSIQ